jgi:spoIIIJ-associated protein
MAEREFEGRNEEEAINKAMESLGLEADEIDVEVVETQRAGFLKGGKVRIRVHLADDETNDAAADAAAGDDRGVREDRGDRDDPEEDLEPENDFERAMVEFVTNLLGKANLPAEVRIDAREEGRLVLEILSPEPAILIGKHGATLEALQLISNIRAGRINDGEPIRVILDAEDYRYRREQSLLHMANRVARDVRRTRRSELIEPLNAFERRIVHTALGEEGDITTESEGDGLYKQIRVMYVGSDV